MSQELRPASPPAPYPEKGWPTAAASMPREALGRQGWNVLAGDLPFPCALLKSSALEANSRAMTAFLEMTGARLCPHGKTSMSPELFHRQIADGAWGITAANARQMQVMRASGVERVLIANQLAGKAEIAAVSEALHAPGFELYVLVDSIDGVADLDLRLTPPEGTRLQVLLEVGQTGGRTGARSLAAAMEVARAVAASRNLALRGVEAFEGILHGASQAELEAKVAALYQALAAAARACEAEGLFASGPVILSGGGSAFYDMAAEGIATTGLKAPSVMVIRSGCYLTHDSKWLADYYARMRARSPEVTAPLPAPEPAIEIWAAVQSMPEPGLALVTMGKRDVSYDMDLPLALKWAGDGMAAPEALSGHRVTALNDQHAYLDCPPDSPLKVGDLIGFGVSHPCTTFDKWRLMAVVDDNYQVIDAIGTCF